MKKLCILILTILLLTGCSSKKEANTLMVTRDNVLYALYNERGKKLTTYQYKTFEEIDGIGYIVTNKEDEKGFISLNGDEIIHFGEYETLEVTDHMLYATKKVEETKEKKEEKKDKETKSKKKKDSKKEESKKSAYVHDNLYVLNKEGKVLYSASQDVGIYKGELPVIQTKDEYIVLYKDGEVLEKTKDEVTYAQHYNQSPCFVISYKDHSVLYDFLESEEEAKITQIEKGGKFQIVALEESMNKGIVLYDEEDNCIIYLDRENQSMDEQTIDIDKIYYDEKNNIIIDQKHTRYIYMPGKKLIEVNSYYLSGSNYLNRSYVIYGPHDIYKDEKKVGELTNCQLYPSPELIQSEIFPVYVKSSGFQYYNFDGKKVLEKVYLDAQPFDINSRAVVREKEAGYSLINDKGNTMTQQYYTNIKYIGSSYYAVYNEEGKFGVINTEGQEIFPIEYTSMSDDPIVVYEDRNYLILDKNGRGYIYDMDDDMKEIFSTEGKITFDTKGFFIVGNEYFTFDGERLE